MHFARPFADSTDARLAIPSLDRKFFAYAIAAVNLPREIDHPAQYFARVEFRNRCLRAEILAAIRLPRALPREPSRRAQLDFRIREHPLDSLSLRKQLAKGAPLLRMIDRHLERRHSDSDVGRRVRKAKPRQQIEA